MQGLDLGRFQFDFDLTFAVLFANADGTVYGRFGARGSEKPMELNSLDGLRHAMQRVLELHGGYPQNAKRLARKRGGKPAFAKAGDIPVPLMRKRRGDETRKGCIHCHQVHEALQDLALERGDYDPARFASRFPPPGQIGLVVDPGHGRRVSRVLGDTVAKRAGLRAGDEILRLAGQEIVSIADLVWVLHHAPARGELAAEVRRGDETKTLTLELTAGWRKPTLAWRGSMYAMPPRPGLWVEEVADAYQRARLRVREGQVALRVRGLFKPAVRRSGLKKGDVIVSYDGMVEDGTAGQFHEYLRLAHWKRGSKLELEVIRDGKREKVTVEF